MEGEFVGNYRIVRKIGEGGMGAVYLAEHALLGRPAAVKMLRREMSHREELVTRFFNEARAATAVKHPGIVEIYDFGYHADGSAYIVMELLEGESLAARLHRTGTVSEAEAVALGRQILGALAGAHGKAIVHRDLKPDNVFIAWDPDVAGGERAKLLDFGIAKLASEHTGQAAMTRTGMMMGTPAYMAPEQCKGAGNVDHRSDLYAVGCILFEMVCGRPPFVAEGAGEVIAHHIFTAPPAPSALARLTPRLEQIILRALAKDAAHRFGSAEEMNAALQAIAPGESARMAASTATAIEARPSRHHALPSRPPYGLPSQPPVQTTMSAAAGVAMTSPAVRPRRPWLAALGALFAISASAGVLVVARGESTPGPAEPAQVAAAPPSTPAHRPEPAVDSAPPPPAHRPEPAADSQPAAVASPSNAAPPAPVRTPAKATLSISSNPADAEVYRMPQAVRIGTTPIHYAVDATPGEVVLLLRKRGYRDQTIAMPADRDAERAVALVRSSSGTTRKGSAAPEPDDFLTKTSGAASGGLDPFARPEKGP